MPARDPLSAIPPSRHPFQFWVIFALSLSGATNFFASGSEVMELVNPFFHKVWASTLMIGGALALVGAYWRDRVTGLLLERIALTAIGISCPTYASVFILQVGISAGVGGVLTLLVGVASLWRVVHVNRELRIMRSFIDRTGIGE